MDGTLSDAELVDRLPHVAVDRDNAEHYRGWLSRELRINRCGTCGRRHHPPRPMCPSCWSWDVTASPVSGNGTIHLAIFLHQGPPAEGVDYSTPHPVVTVELDEQPDLRFTSTVVGTPNDEIVIGMRVALDWIERNGAPYPVFRRA